MCDPITLAVIGTAAAGTAMQTISHQQQISAEQNAANQAMIAEANRQAAMDKQRQATLTQIIGKTEGRSNVDNAQKAATAIRQQVINQNTTPLPNTTGAPSPAEAGQVGMQTINNAYQGRAAHDQATTDARGQALAALSGLGDALQNLSMQRQPMLDSIAANDQAAQQSAALLPSEINTAVRNASQTGSGLGMLGDVLSNGATAALGHYAATGHTLTGHSPTVSTVNTMANAGGSNGAGALNIGNGLVPASTYKAWLNGG